MMTYDTDGAGINSVYTGASNKPIKLAQSEDGMVHITYYESERESYTLNDSNGELSLKYKRSKSLTGMFSLNINTADYSVLVELPVDFSGGIELSTSNGSIKLECENTLKSVCLGTSNGKINVKGVTVTGSLDAKSSNGSVTLEDIKAQAVTVKLSNGGIALSAVDAQSLNLKTSNGSISGSVVGRMGDYKIKSGTSNGKNNLPSDKEDGSRSLTAQTSNGSIEIAFRG